MAIKISNAVNIKLVEIKNAFINESYYAIDGIQKLIMIMNNIMMRSALLRSDRHRFSNAPGSAGAVNSAP